jgi:phosphoribosylaminoimidazole-succinocarboxamide synthase
MQNRNVVMETDLKIPGARKYSGKVSDVYFLPGVGSDYGEGLPNVPINLHVYCDRVSANNKRLKPGIYRQGKNLMRLTGFWSPWLTEHLGVPTHYLTSDILNTFGGYDWMTEEILDRSFVALTLNMLGVENITRMIVRAAGSGWKQYRKDQTICGIQLPAGLKPGDMFPETLWTPTYKNDLDPWMTPNAVINKFGQEIARKLKYYGLMIQHAAHGYLFTKGIINPDGKTEWGLDENGVLRLADEYLTPHSACFYLLENFRQGELISMDKDIIRVFLDANPDTDTLSDEMAEIVSVTFDRVTNMIVGAAA